MSTPTFYSIHSFRNSLEYICKREKNGYHSCAADICNRFAGYSFEDIWEMHFRILDQENIRIIKIRVPNSFLNLSASDGFRLIVCCNKKDQSITFLNVYPKRGKLAQFDQSKDEFKQQLRSYGSDKKGGALVEHDINNKLKVVEKKEDKG
jgi:predicted aldo/keto reductase-like oxidoreductase